MATTKSPLAPVATVVGGALLAIGSLLAFAKVEGAILEQPISQNISGLDTPDGNEETFWVIMRMNGSWAYVSIGLVIIHFVIPFLVLLPRSSKVNPKLLIVMSIWMLFAHAYDLYWLIMPTYSPIGAIFGWSELGFIMFAVGLVITVFKIRSEKTNLMPIGDPKLESGLNFHLN